MNHTPMRRKTRGARFRVVRAIPSRSRLAITPLVAIVAALIGLTGCLEGSSGWATLGPGAGFSLGRPQPVNAVPAEAIKAATEGKGYVRSTTEWGVGEAPDKRSATSEESGWSPTPQPEPHSTEGKKP